MIAPATDNRCPACFSLGSERPCSHCGWRTGEENTPPFLALKTVLDGRYRIGRALGHGGFGITYLAWDENLRIALAIKEYLPGDLATRAPDRATLIPYTGQKCEWFEYGLGKFLEEAQLLARFQQHPGIVSVLNFFRANATGYMVMEYVDGITLKQHLERQPEGRIPYAQANQLLIPVMDALRAVHKDGLLHRDIAPDNIYITCDGRIKLLDFGAARFAAGEHSRSLSVILKPGYAPEEQYRSRGKQGPWSDVYALAATLYRAIAGEVPPEALDRLDEDDLIAPRQRGCSLPVAAEAALLKALAIRTRDRYESMAEFQQALQRPQEPPEPQPTPRTSPQVEASDPRLSPVDPKPQSAPATPDPEPSPVPAPMARQPAALDKAKDPTTGMEFVRVPGGCYRMGSNDGDSDEKPVHEVCVDEFWLGKYEVTQGQWTKVMGDNPSYFKTGDDYPVENVSWEDVQAYISKLNTKGSAQYRLPTEAEWEYACRSGGRDEKYSGSGSADSVAWYDDNSDSTTHAVGTKDANGLGLHDMSGNLWEWVQDIYTSNAYSSHFKNNPVNTGGGSLRVIRGGGWYRDAAIARCADRSRGAPGAGYTSLGFRLLRTQ